MQDEILTRYESVDNIFHDIPNIIPLEVFLLVVKMKHNIPVANFHKNWKTIFLKAVAKFSFRAAKKYGKEILGYRVKVLCLEEYLHIKI